MGDGASDGIIRIAGAGPAGLASAITLARAGRRVIVHEAQRAVGYRFGGDLQGLENWTTQQDVLEELDGLGLTTAFDMRGCREGMAFDAWGRAYPVRCRAPLFYMVERGPGAGSLDAALLAQAQGLGVEVRFNDRLGKLPGRSLLEGSDYDRLWRDALAPELRTSIVNRALYDLLGNGGYRWLLRWQVGGDARAFLHGQYRPAWAKRMLWPWARSRYVSRRRDVSCDHVDCHCIWCRCGAEPET